MEENNEAQDRLLKFKRDMERLGLAPVKPEEYVSPLNEAALTFKGAATNADVTPITNIVKGGTDKINTKEVQKLISGNSFKNKISDILESRKLAKAATAAGKGLKALPLIGPAIGLASAFATGDASAAVPVLNDIEGAGPMKGSIESKIENGTATQDEIDQLFNKRFR